MALGRELKRRARSAAMPVVFLAITGYFCWNATQGPRGLVAYAQREDLLRQVQADHAAAVAEHDMWERRLGGLRPNHPDGDTIDERARSMLNLAQPNEVIVQYTAKDKLF